MIADVYNSLTPKEKYLIAKYGFDMARGYLRGTKAFQSRRAPTLANKVDRLSRQVNRQKPEKIHFINNTNVGHVVGHKTFEADVTRVFIDSTRFRDDITGDKWYNHSLDLRIKFDAPINALRVIIYTPKRSGTTSAGLTTGFSNFNTPLDPTAFVVHSDRAYNPGYNSAQPFLKMYTKLNSLTQYNSETDTIDRNNIRIAFLYDASATGTIYFSYDLTVTNK